MVGIYERIQESKKTRKQDKKKENKNSTKKKKIFFLDHFLCRVLIILFSCFLTFLFTFINSHLWTPLSDTYTMLKGQTKEKLNFDG